MCLKDSYSANTTIYASRTVTLLIQLYMSQGQLLCWYNYICLKDSYSADTTIYASRTVTLLIQLYMPQGHRM
jgi:hypothetical protein